MLYYTWYIIQTYWYVLNALHTTPYIHYICTLCIQVYRARWAGRAVVHIHHLRAGQRQGRPQVPADHRLRVSYSRCDIVYMCIRLFIFVYLCVLIDMLYIRLVIIIYTLYTHHIHTHTPSTPHYTDIIYHTILYTPNTIYIPYTTLIIPYKPHYSMHVYMPRWRSLYQKR